MILKWLHDSPLGGHFGRDVIAVQIKSLFFWKDMTKDIQQNVKNCDICQRCKPDLAASSGLLQTLPIPNKVQDEISMDFIEGLPSFHGKQVIFVVVDRLSSTLTFYPYPTLTCTTLDLAYLFLDHVINSMGCLFPSLVIKILFSLARFGVSCFNFKGYL